MRRRCPSLRRSRLGFEPLEARRLLSVTVQTSPVGDYNGDLRVDAADFTRWRDNEGASVAPGAFDRGADGTGDNQVDGADYQLWRDHFGLQLEPPPQVTGVTATRVPGLNSSTITLALSSPLVGATPASLLANTQVTAAAANPAFATLPAKEPEFVDVTIGVTAAALAPDGMSITLTTDLMTPAGATVTITDPSLMQPTASGDLPVQILAATTASDISDAEFVFAFRGDNGFRVTDQTLVASSPLSGLPIILDDMVSFSDGLNRLAHILNVRLAVGQIDQTEYDYAIDLYESPVLDVVVPDHNLRASLVSTIGDPAEQALSVVLQGRDVGVTPPTGSVFEGASVEPLLIRDVSISTELNSIPAGAQAIANLDGTTSIELQQLYQSEPIGAIAGLLVHEILVHSSGIESAELNGVNEEVFAAAFADATTYIRYVSLAPSIANAASVATRLQIENAVVFLNSGSTGLSPGLQTSPVRGSLELFGFPFPLSQDNFEDVNRLFLGLGTDLEDVPTQLSPFLSTYIESFTGSPPVSNQFDAALLAQVDAAPGVTAEQAIAFAEAISLSIAPPPVLETIGAAVDGTTVTVFFAYPIELVAFANPAALLDNFALDGQDDLVTAAVVEPDGQTLTLTLTQPPPPAATLTVEASTLTFTTGDGRQDVNRELVIALPAAALATAPAEPAPADAAAGLPRPALALAQAEAPAATRSLAPRTATIRPTPSDDALLLLATRPLAAPNDAEALDAALALGEDADEDEATAPPELSAL